LSASFQTPMVPPQEAPVQQVQGQSQPSNLFSILWYKFLDSVQRKLNDLQNQIDALAPSITAQYVTDGVTTGDAATVLSAGTNTVISPVATPNAGDIWTAYLTQPAAGNALVTYAGIVPAVHLVTTNDLDRRPNKVTVVTFMCRADGDWWLQSVLMGR
jgi:hypothetical protein